MRVRVLRPGSEAIRRHGIEDQIPGLDYRKVEFRTEESPSPRGDTENEISEPRPAGSAAANPSPGGGKNFALLMAASQGPAKGRYRRESILRRRGKRWSLILLSLQKKSGEILPRNPCSQGNDLSQMLTTAAPADLEPPRKMLRSRGKDLSLMLPTGASKTAQSRAIEAARLRDKAEDLISKSRHPVEVGVLEKMFPNVPVKFLLQCLRSKELQSPHPADCSSCTSHEKEFDHGKFCLCFACPGLANNCSRSRGKDLSRMLPMVISGDEDEIYRPITSPISDAPDIAFGVGKETRITSRKRLWDAEEVFGRF